MAKNAKQILLILAFTAMGAVLFKVPYALFTPPFNTLQHTAGPLVFLAAMCGLNLGTAGLLLGLSWFFTARIDKKPLSSAGLFWGCRSGRLLLLGTLIAAVAGAIASLAYYWMDEPSVTLIVSTWSVGLVLVLSFIAVFFQATYEELWFRSWSLWALAGVVGERWAAVINGVLFGLLHLVGNPLYSVTSSITALAAGVMMAFAVFHTRSIWMAMGIHFGWNAITHRVFFNQNIVAVISPGGEAVNGFDGAEGTLIGMIAMLCAMLTVIFGAKLFGRDTLFPGRPHRQGDLRRIG